jgi:hypothetical protein
MELFVEALVEAILNSIREGEGGEGDVAAVAGEVI